MKYLIIGIVLLLGVIIYLKTYAMRLANNSGFENIKVDEFKEILSEKSQAILLDVRTSNEHAHGNIPNSVNIDVMRASFEEQINQLDKDKTYLVYCRSGMRSAKAAGIMSNLGFESVYNLIGGFNAWK